MVTPWLTVAMTTFNARDYLATALDSVISQGDRDIEVIAVDDASTDETLAILESYKSRVELRIITRELNTANWMAGLNAGLRAARGDYVCFLQHDDYWLDGRLATARRLLARGPDIKLLLHPARFVDFRGSRLGTWNCPLPCGRELLPDEVIGRLLIHNFVAVAAPLFRRDSAIQVGGLDETLWYSGDWDFWLKLAAAGRTSYHPVPTVAYRIHNQSMTWWRTAEQIAEQRRQLELVYDRHSVLLASRQPIRPSVENAARYSIEVNTRLAAYAHGQDGDLVSLASDFLKLGPAGWRRYLRDSRIVERVSARLRAGMLRWGRPTAA